MLRSALRVGHLAAVVVAVLAGAALIAACTSSKAVTTPTPKPVSKTAPPSAVAPLTAQDWAAYLNGPRHTSYSPTQTQITPANAADLVQKWHHAPGKKYLSSPTVADGAVFIGSNTGWFYKLDETTGAVLDRVFLGHQPKKTCPARGMVDTATVAVDPANHQDTVYVGGPSGYLYAFSASDLTLEWKSVIGIPSTKTSNYFEWSSPTVTNGKIYIGISSNCDNPLIYGGIVGYDQATGRKFAELHTVPKGVDGGSVWSSIGVAPDGDLYASTGNGPNDAPRVRYSEAILKLNPDTLKVLGLYKIPPAQVTFDADFGGSPVFFGHDVGACNKNGYFYAVRQSTMTLAWERRIGAGSSASTPAQCSAAPIYNGKDLFFGGPAATYRGTAYRGSVQERNPANGRLIWETGLPNGVIGSPTMDGGGVIAVGTYDDSSIPNATYLIDAANGKVLRTLVKATDFAQSVFANGWLFTANANGVFAWAPSS
jgi:outer membrane protein assembly factor BamB